mmetsp:Transcript_1613/g.5695  ORF Transcript_1613/g.5695 Transcript_1613/m.5695 type:complete len:263 (+) Transcript_1613:147-935(+)
MPSWNQARCSAGCWRTAERSWSSASTRSPEAEFRRARASSEGRWLEAVARALRYCARAAASSPPASHTRPHSCARSGCRRSASRASARHCDASSSWPFSRNTLLSVTHSRTRSTSKPRCRSWKAAAGRLNMVSWLAALWSSGSSSREARDMDRERESASESLASRSGRAAGAGASRTSRHACSSPRSAAPSSPAARSSRARTYISLASEGWWPSAMRQTARAAACSFLADRRRASSSQESACAPLRARAPRQWRSAASTSRR